MNYPLSLDLYTLDLFSGVIVHFFLKMSAFRTLIIANLRNSGDQKMIQLADKLEEDSVQDFLNKEDRLLECRPLHQKLAEGDGAEVLPRKTLRRLKEWGQDW